MFKGLYARQCFLLTNGAAFISRHAFDLRFNAVEGFDLLEALLGDGGDIVDGQLKQFTPRMCPAIGQLNGGVITPIFDTVIACITIYLQHAAKALQYLDRMLARTTWRIGEDNTWWR